MVLSGCVVNFNDVRLAVTPPKALWEAVRIAAVACCRLFGNLQHPARQLKDSCTLPFQHTSPVRGVQ